MKFSKKSRGIFWTGHFEGGKSGESGIFEFKHHLQHYHWLREYALDHDEAGDIFRAVDWSEFSNYSLKNCRHAATFLSNRYLSMGYVLRIKNQLTETHRPRSATFRLWSRCVSSCVLSATRQAIEVVVCGKMLRRCGFFGRGGVKNSHLNLVTSTPFSGYYRHCTVGSGSGCWGATPKFFSFLKNLRYFISTTVWQYLTFIAKLYL